MLLAGTPSSIDATSITDKHKGYIKPGAGFRAMESSRRKRVSRGIVRGDRTDGRGLILCVG